MKILTGLARKENVIALSSLSLISFIARALLDWRYVFPLLMDLTTESVAITTFFYLLFVGAWLWALVNLSQRSKTALFILLIANSIQFFFNGVLSSLALCPSPCQTIWPVGEIIIWSSTITGLFALVAVITNWRHMRSIY